MDRKEDKNSQGEAARIFVEFLEVAITSIIFHKGIYPNGAFERRRYMSLVVHKASHPQLRDYINSAVNGLLPFILKGLVERVAVIFFDNNNVPIERFVFKVNLNLSYGSRVEETDFQFALRSFLIKLPASEQLTKVLPQGKFMYRRLNFGMMKHSFLCLFFINPTLCS